MLVNIFKNLYKDLKLSQYENYEFAKDAYIVPIGLEEMIVAAKSLLIIFVKDENNNISPSIYIV